MLTGVWVLAAVILALAKASAEILLATLNLGELRKWESAPPPDRAALTTPERHRKSVMYTRARLRFGLFAETWDFAVLAFALMSGLPAWILDSQVLDSWGLWGEAFGMALVLLTLAIASLPIDFWSTFVIEQRFGFNRTTRGLWIGDKVKGMLVAIAIGVPLLALILFLMESLGSGGWAWGWLAFMVWQLLLMVLFPSVILPLFNKLTPLESGPLRTRLVAFASATGFPVGRIDVMDGSRRSAHSNAFFAGFGKARRIVLYDTLLRQLDECELEAVLAHEIGHWKRGHLTRRLLASALLSGAAFALFGWVSQSPEVVAAFGFKGSSETASALLLCILLAEPIGYWIAPLMSRLSRKHEFEADAWAADQLGTPKPLVAALLKLQAENLGNLVAHPLASAVHDSHPPLHERLTALESRLTSNASA